MIKLIASDVDGTLVSDGGGKLDKRIVDMIKAVHDKGIHFAVASGRQWVSIENVFEEVKDKIFYISDNGAYIGVNGRSLFINKMDDEISKKLIIDIRKNKDLIAIVADESSYYIEENNEFLIDWIRGGYMGRIELVDDLTKVKNVIKISAYSENVYGKADDIIEKYSDKLLVNYAGEMWLDCTAKGVSTGNALKKLQEAFDITEHETMVFGDQANDVEMFKAAYYSFAVKNAAPVAKEAARFMADSNENLGVLKILNYLL